MSENFSEKTSGFFFRKNFWLIILNYLPGLVMLVFGMLALYSSLTLIREQQELFSIYRTESRSILELEETYNDFEKELFLAVKGNADSTLENLQFRLKEFARLYFSELQVKVLEQQLPENYKEAFFSIEGDVLVLSQFVGSIKTLADVKVSDYQKTAAIHDKIEGLWSYLYDDDHASAYLTQMRSRESWLYWSVIAVGLCGFIMVLLNADKLTKLSIVNKEKKQTLKLLENRLAAMEATYDGIGIVDAEGCLTYMNQSLMRLHGIMEADRSEYIGQDWANLYTEKGRQKIKNVVLPAVHETGYWRGISPIVRLDGSVVHTDLSLTRLVDGGFIGTARDITDQVQAEKDKKDLEGQFYQAQKMEAVGRLAGGIAHDFNNILAAMNGYAEFLCEDLDEGSKEQEFAKNILQAGRQARNLVDQMLAFSRRKENDFQAVDLVSPLRESLSMLKVSLPRTIEVVEDIDVLHAIIKGNDTQISQVIMNLCVNAKDAMEDKGTLHIHLQPVEADLYSGYVEMRSAFPDQKETPNIHIDDLGSGRTRLVLGCIIENMDYISLEIKDSGSGMSRAIMEHIFEPFFTTKPVDKGTGLGLATVHGVVASHQGALIIESVLGEGTRFELLFPVLKESQIESTAGQIAMEEEVEACILLVEDQKEVRDMMLNMLERLGFEVYTCETGLEGLEVLRENPGAFDLVITDHNMPVMTGLEMIYQVYFDQPELPFILVSGHGEQELKYAMDDHPAIRFFLRKPIQKDELKQKIMRVLADNKKRGEAA